MNTSQYLNLINDWVYPEIEGLDIRWVPTCDDGAKGIVVIKIPPQREAIKPFLIKNVVDGGRKIEIIFGYAERRRDTSQSFSVVELQRALRSGLNYESKLNERFDGLEALLKQLTNHSATPEQKITPEEIDLRVGNTLGHGEIGNKRLLVLSAYPTQPGELRTLFSTAEGSIRKRLERPPNLRFGGWNLETLEQGEILKGELVRITNDHNKVIDLYRDGTFIFAGRVDETFLGWGSENGKINPVAIVEIVYNFVDFYRLVLEDFKDRPALFSVRIELRNMHLGGVPNFLVPYRSGSHAQEFNLYAKNAPDDRMALTKEFGTENFDPGPAAFEILKEIYLWFGLDEDKIPYTKTEAGVTAVNPQEIISL